MKQVVGIDFYLAAVLANRVFSSFRLVERLLPLLTVILSRAVFLIGSLYVVTATITPTNSE